MHAEATPAAADRTRARRAWPCGATGATDSCGQSVRARGDPGAESKPSVRVWPGSHRSSPAVARFVEAGRERIDRAFRAAEPSASRLSPSGEPRVSGAALVWVLVSQSEAAWVWASQQSVAERAPASVARVSRFRPAPEPEPGSTLRPPRRGAETLQRRCEGERRRSTTCLNDPASGSRRRLQESRGRAESPRPRPRRDASWRRRRPR